MDWQRAAALAEAPVAPEAEPGPLTGRVSSLREALPTRLRHPDDPPDAA